jgi:Gpi18-like mannosyltransferase
MSQASRLAARVPPFSGIRTGPGTLMLVLLTGLAVRLAFIREAGYASDQELMFGWLRAALNGPPATFYHRGTMNYGPGAALVFQLAATALGRFAGGDPNASSLRVALKLPAILAELGSATLAYAIVSRLSSRTLGIAAAAFIAFDPPLIYDTAYWGQIDALPTFFAIFALFQLAFGSALLAWLLLAFAVLTKTPILVLAPLFLLHPFCFPGASERRRRVRQTIAGILAAGVLCEGLALLYFPNPTWLGSEQALFDKLYGGSRLFPYNSLNAFNFWALFGDFDVPDSHSFLGLPLRVWGYGLFLIAVLAICTRYALAAKGEPNANARGARVFEAAALLLLAMFLFLTQMHERYLYYSVCVLGMLFFRRSPVVAAALLSLTLLLNLEYALTFYYLNGNTNLVHVDEFAPWLVHLCALSNIGVFFWLLRDFLRRSAAGHRRRMDAWAFREHVVMSVRKRDAGRHAS